MSKKLAALAVAILLVAGVTVYTMFFSQPRLTSAQQQKALESQRQLDEAKAKTAQAAAPAPATQASESTPAPQAATPATPAPAPAETWPEKAPDLFKVKFACSMGDFVIECHKDWAPIGVERFYELVKSGFYNEGRFFRVVPDFVVQFGLPADPSLAAKWRTQNLKDEPVKQGNTAGTITFAKTNAPNSRTTQIFINLKDNAQLDGMGFAAFGKVTEGMDMVNKINPEYGGNPRQDMIQNMGNEYLKQAFPRLDYVKSVTLVK